MYHLPKKLWWLAITFFFILLRVAEAQSYVIGDVSVSCDPNIVGSQSSTLKVQFSSTSLFKAGGKVQVIVPQQALVVTGSRSCSIRNYNDQGSLPCFANSTDNSLNISLPFDLPANLTVQVDFEYSFNAPLSTAPTDSFQIKLINSSGTLVANQTNGIQLSKLELASIQAAKITQLNNAQVGNITQVFFSVTTLNPIPPGGGIQIKMPKWNPMAPSSLQQSFFVKPEDYNTTIFSSTIKRLLQQTTQSCSPRQLGVVTQIRCQHQISDQNDFLTIIDAFPNGQRAGQTFEFNVAYLRNPISLSGVTFNLTTFSGISSNEGDGTKIIFTGLIDQGSAQIIAQDGADMDPSSCQVVAKSTTVQDFSIFSVLFQVPVPVQSGCNVEIQLPDDFVLGIADISMVQGSGIFIAKTQLTSEIDTINRIIKVSGQCSRYSGANILSSIELQSIKNPSYVKETKTFGIKVLDSNNKLIASVNQFIKYKTTSGTVKNISLLSKGGTDIQNTSDLLLSFTPAHALTDNSFLQITLPNNIDFSCKFFYTQNLKTVPNCIQFANNTLQFNQTFIGNYPGNQPLNIIFQNRLLPVSQQDIKGIVISTFQIFNGQAYLVDYFQDLNLVFFTAQSVLFFSAQVQSTASTTYTNTSLTFSLTLANDVPIGGIIKIVFPNDLIVDTMVAQTNCFSTQGLQVPIQCLFTTQSLSSNENVSGQQITQQFLVLTIKDGFKTRGLNKQDDFSITLNAGIISPISTKTTDTFSIQVTDSLGQEINFFNTELVITMKIGIDIGSLNLTSDSYVVGAQAYHTLSFIAPAPLYNQTHIFISIPEEIGTPMASQFNITSTYPFAQNFQNWIIGNKVTIFVAIDPSLNSQAISQGTKIQFTIGPLKNPQSLAPSSLYSLHIESSDSYEIAQQITPGVKMRNQKAATITDYGFTANDLRQGALTTITISWVNTQAYPKDLSLIIKFDATQIFPKLPTGQTSTPCLFRQSRFVTCQIFDGFIKVGNFLASPQIAGQNLSLTITNMYINITTPIITNSWKMETYTQAGIYMIDQIIGPMSFQFNCTFPCETCLDGQPEKCNSCNDYDLGTYLILYQGICIRNCPDGTYEESFQCHLCDPKCKTCAKNSPLYCTSCDPNSIYPFLDGNTCTNQCSFGDFGNYAKAMCDSCNGPCLSCTGDANTCLTCDQTIPAKYFYENQCLTACPFGQVADVEKRSTICEPCLPNCNGCIGRKDICAACPTGSLLNLVQNKNNCLSTCPPNISVENRSDPNNPICQPCDSNCLTCSGNAKFCTSCGENLNLDSINGVCTLQCDTKNGLEVPLDGQCVPCDSSCATCQGTKDNCLTCWPGTHWYNKQCLNTCPLIESYQYAPNDDNKCIIPGLYCKFGYKVSETGDFCELVLSVCPSPSKLNYDKNKCIPGSDKWVPFPIWIIYVIPTFVILAISKLKKKQTNFVSNWICFLSIAEIAAMIYVTYLAKRYGIMPVVALICFALAIHYGINFFFLLVFTKTIRNDKAFSYWCEYNKKTTNWITVIGTIINFKMYRLFFSRLFGREEFNAPMESQMNFYSPFNLASLLNLLLVKLVLVFACVFTCYYISWGYQLLIEAIELLAIEVVMLLLCVIEYFQMRADLFKQKAYVKIDPRRVEEHKVMGGLDEMSDDIGYSHEIIDPKLKERKGKPKALKTIQQMENILRHLDVKKLERNYEGNLNSEFYELNEKEIMRRQKRHCVSFRGLATKLPQAWESEDEQYAQNFISEPNSPRSKEMLHNGNFISRMLQLHEVYKKREQFDNVYHQSVDFQKKPMRNVKLVSVKVQTNVIELLGVDDLLLGPQSEQESLVSSQSSRYFEEIIDDKATRNLIDSVISKIDSEKDSIDSEEAREEEIKQKWIAEQLRIQELEKLNQKPKKLTKQRLAEIPNFDPEEIVGEFTQDQKGYNLMVRTRFGKLNDRFGRQINRRGYLLDENGNVVTRGGVFIFYADEINDDDDIPAPYSLNKVSQMLFRVQDYTEYKKLQKLNKLAMQDDFIEKEYQRLKAESQVRDRVKTQSQFAQPSVPLDKSCNLEKSSDMLQIQSPMTAQIFENDSLKIKEDESISKIIEPIKPKTKSELLGKQSQSSFVSKSRQLSGESKIRKLSQHSNNQSKKSRNIAGSTGDEIHNAGVNLSNQLILMRSESELNQKLSNHSNGHIPEEQSQHNEKVLFDLNFETKNLQKVKKKKKKARKKSKGSSQSIRGILNENQQVYLDNLQKLEANSQAIKQDDEFIKKMNKFNDYVNEKKRRFQNDVRNQLFNAASGSSIQMKENSIVQPDGSIRSIGLRHQNLGQIYGRVRQNFNAQIRQGGAALKYKSKEPRNLLPHNNITAQVFPDNILSFDIEVDESHLIPHKQSLNQSLKRANKTLDSQKLQELQQIYTNPRPEHVSAKRERANLPNSNSFVNRSDPQIAAQKSILNRFGPKSTAVIQPIFYNDLPMKIADLSLNESQIRGKDTEENVSKQMHELKHLLGEANNSSSFDIQPSSVQKPKKKTTETNSVVVNAGAFDLLHGKYI